MALPVLSTRGDIVVKAAWAPATPLSYTNFCGATSITLSIENAVQETQTGDCDDWSKPAVTLAAYGAQSCSMTINAQLAASNRDKLLRWAKDQLVVPIRVQIVNAAAGEVEYIDGDAMLPSLNVEQIGNLAGDVITVTLNLRFEDGLTFVDKEA